VETHPKIPRIKILLVAAIFLLCSSCVDNLLSVNPQNPAPSAGVAGTADSDGPLLEGEHVFARMEEGEEPALFQRTRKDKNRTVTAPRPPENHRPPPAPEIPRRSDQKMLDSALEFLQTSSEYWERGEMESALEALDQAYSLILEVNAESDPEILQQKEDLRFTISKRIIEVYSSRFTTTNGHYKEIPLVMNSHVERALKLFSGSERNFFIDAYKRSGTYRPAILKALKEAGLPEELSWLPLIESGFKIRALSRARALGLWQFIASTGYKFGLKRDLWIDERMDPHKSTMAAIAYLKELHQIFGDWTTALAAYNCGEGAVLRVIRTQRINYLDHFWDLYEKLPTETAFYVPKFLAVLHILNAPEAYGFALPPVEEEVETEEVPIDKQVHLSAVAKSLDIPYEVLKDLNPALRREATPDRPYAIRVPKGSAEMLLAKLNDIPSWKPPVPSYTIHRVRYGESLSSIAAKHGTSVRSIMSLNGLKSRHYIRVGWNLKVPTRRSYISIARSPVPDDSPGWTDRSVTYVVQKGDTLWKIADRFRLSTRTIMAYNGLRSSRLQVGQVLKIPTPSDRLTASSTKKYEVMEGDSLSVIAQKHQMELGEFLKLNNLTVQSTIFPGQVLLVRSH